MPTPLSIPPTAAEVEVERRREANRAAYDRANAPAGVRFSGMYEAPVAASDATIEARAIKSIADRLAFWSGPRGAFMGALGLITKNPDLRAYNTEIETARAAYYRGIECDPPIHAEIAVATIALNRVPGRDARTAIEALQELLLQRQAAA